MAEDVFDRVYSLTVGRNKGLIEKTIPQLLVQPQVGVPQLLADPSYTDFNAKPNGAILVTELRITADIQYTKEGSTNKQGSVITIYNLNRDNQKSISSEDTVLLRAGYRSTDGDNPPLIFAGQVDDVMTEKKGQDTITKLVCTATSIPRKNVRFSKMPVRNETNLDVANYFADLAAANGIPKGRVFIQDVVTYPSGYAAGGSFWYAMEKFCQDFNLNCYTTLGRLYIEPIAVTAPATAKVIVSAENIKDSIRSEDDAAGKSSPDVSKKSGIVFNTFLNGNITPAKLVNIDFGEFRGDYLISSVSHKLDLEGNSWDTIVSCKRREG
jgi:hypothetical protein